MWNVAGGSMGSTIATVVILSMAIDGARARMVGHGPKFSAAGRGRRLSRRGAGRVRSPRSAGTPLPGDAGRLRDRRAVSHVPPARAAARVARHDPGERLAPRAAT